MKTNSVIEVFDSDDDAYLEWLAHHSSGYVINSRRKPDPHYMVLHSAQCPAISRYTKMAKPGGFTERSYVKVCADTVDALRGYVRCWRKDRSFSAICSMCKPSIKS